MSSFQQTRFDAAMFSAALDYYGLPANYNRFFTSSESRRRREMRYGFMTVGTWWGDEMVPCHPAQASQAGRVVWAQVNLPVANHPLQRAEVPDIELYQNFVLDFEYPSDPSVAVEIGLELARYLLELGLAEPHDDWLLEGKPSMPIECSGAGVHICLPLLPLRTAALGGPDILSDAVTNLVMRFIQPQFDLLVANAVVNTEIHLDGYDISQVLSFPGTWRPSSLKFDDCEELGSGFLRRWYTDDSQPITVLHPRRRESVILAQLITEECRILSDSIASIQQDQVDSYEPVEKPDR